MCFKKNLSSESLVGFINQIIAVTNIKKEDILTGEVIDLEKLLTLMEEKSIVGPDQIVVLSNLIQEKKEQVSK